MEEDNVVALNVDTRIPMDSSRMLRAMADEIDKGVLPENVAIVCFDKDATKMTYHSNSPVIKDVYYAVSSYQNMIINYANGEEDTLD